MALVTVVRSNVGERIELPGGQVVRPWCYVELQGTLGDEEKKTLKVLERAGRVQLAQVVDGAPLSTVDLDRRGA